jgi:hypothetical protein
VDFRRNMIEAVRFLQDDRYRKLFQMLRLSKVRDSKQYATVNLVYMVKK